jgi:hypothetical protein
MNNNIKVSVNDGVTWSTDSPFKVFTYCIAIEFYEMEHDTAIKASELAFEVYMNLNTHNMGDVVDYICENFRELPDDFNLIVDKVHEDISDYEF